MKYFFLQHLAESASLQLKLVFLQNYITKLVAADIKKHSLKSFIFCSLWYETVKIIQYWKMHAFTLEHGSCDAVLCTYCHLQRAGCEVRLCWN